MLTRKKVVSTLKTPIRMFALGITILDLLRAKCFWKNNIITNLLPVNIDVENSKLFSLIFNKPRLQK